MAIAGAAVHRRPTLRWPALEFQSTDEADTALRTLAYTVMPCHELARNEAL